MMGILLYGLLNGPLYLMQAEGFPPKGDENFQALSFEDLRIVYKTFMSFKQTHINYWLLNQKIGHSDIHFFRLNDNYHYQASLYFPIQCAVTFIM